MVEEKKQKGKTYISKSRELLMKCRSSGEQKRYRQLPDGTMLEIREPEILIDFSPDGIYDTSEIADDRTRERVEARIESDVMFRAGEIGIFTDDDRRLVFNQQELEKKARELEQQAALQDEQKKRLEDEMAEFERKKQDWAADQARLKHEQEAEAAKQAPAPNATPGNETADNQDQGKSGGKKK